MTTFNIGSQNAQNINLVGRDQRITGGQRAVAAAIVSDQQARQAAAELREAVAAVRLDGADATQATAQADEIAQEIQAPQPNRPRIASALHRLTQLLVKAGQVATAGAAVWGPLRTLAGWLGAQGQSILQLLR